MKFINVDAVVIREVNSGEADKVLTVISVLHGKMVIYAKGARRTRSRLLASAQLLSYSKFVLIKGRDMYSISSAELIEPFYNIRNDLSKLTYTSYFCEVLDDVVVENQANVNIVKLLLVTLFKMNSDNANGNVIVRTFELRLLSYIGYTPYVKGCIICSSSEKSKYWFSFLKFGFLCDDCYKNDINSINLSNGATMTIKHIIFSEIRKLYNFNITKNVEDELDKVIPKYFSNCLDKKYKKLDFLKLLNRYN